MAHTFDISPEKRASRANFIWRQLFVTPPPVSSDEINLAGRTALVTGATGGIGLEITRQLLSLGCKVIIGVRDERKGELVRQDLLQESNLDDDMVQVWKLDLSSYQSIISFAANAKSLDNLNIAILNAGIYKVSEAFSSTGYEEGMQINYLSNILLLIKLLPIIKKNAPNGETGHVCLVSSDTAAWAKFEERTSTPLLPAFKKPMQTWDMGKRYGKRMVTTSKVTRYSPLFEFHYERDGRLVVRETHYAENKLVQDGRSGPPLHIHCGQTEYFQVESGTLAVIRNEKKSVLTQGGGIIKIPPGTRHRFWAEAPVTEDLVFRVWAEPQNLNRGFDEAFLRNYLGFLRDCEDQNIQPSIFQLALLGWGGDTLLSPPFWVPLWILRLFHFILAHLVGRLLLGYTSSYPEYNPKSNRDEGGLKKTV
ncbi:ankyrin repeat domain protein [Fusarium sp. NRRL 52700]|nr:ankyrin repeat domain protein [Fusarium sp. NRRL 52700]